MLNILSFFSGLDYILLTEGNILYLCYRVGCNFANNYREVPDYLVAGVAVGGCRGWGLLLPVVYATDLVDMFICCPI